MRAAVVRSFDQPPRYEEFSSPVVGGDHEVVVDVVAAALHPRVRSTADGSHYESTGELPLVPGIDGVGRTPAGELVYFVLPDTLLGSMAEQVVIDRRRSAVLPPDVDPEAVAAAMNPAMSSWIALKQRVSFEAGQRVLVLGATGNAGQLAVQIAKHLGASRVVAAGRNVERLAALTSVGADATVELRDDPAATSEAIGDAAADVDVVIDYLWGSAAELAIPALLSRRTDRAQPLTWIEIGSMAGLELSLQSQWLRAARLQVLGSGQGSVSTRDIVAELPALAAHIAGSGYELNVKAAPLGEVEGVWTASRGSSDRVVFVP